MERALATLMAVIPIIALTAHPIASHSEEALKGGVRQLQHQAARAGVHAGKHPAAFRTREKLERQQW